MNERRMNVEFLPKAINPVERSFDSNNTRRPMLVVPLNLEN